MLGIKAKSSPGSHVSTEYAGLAVVSISDGNQSYGLYRVKQVGIRAMVLGHGAISFPVGMCLDVEDFEYLAPNRASFHQRATVAENGHDGIRLVW